MPWNTQTQAVMSCTFQTEAAYGLHHFYSADPWNEQTASSFEHDYIRDTAQSIYSGMAQVDEQAVWYVLYYFDA